MSPTAVAVLGSGRVGLTLARALVHSGHHARLLVRTARRSVDGLPSPETDWADALRTCDCVIIAVPDDAIAEVATLLAQGDGLTGQQVVLHTSGLHGSEVLSSLSSSGAALGSFHPLQAFPAGGSDASLLSGIPAVVEGDPRAVEAGKWLAGLLGMEPVLELSATGKRRYHAAAVVASNYLVVLADMAQRLAREAGAGDASSTLFGPIMRQVLADVAQLGPTAALTGPVRRGDAGTVAAHLEVLRGDDRAAYVALGREALLLARRAGLASDAAAAVERLFDAV
ncbi:MAG: DUF2520 domain-containing protein [Gemmatimonadota bacterium]